jgi:hypothetical protein
MRRFQNVGGEHELAHHPHNELLARNVAALNHNGTFPDALELYNEGSASWICPTSA